MSKSCLNNFRFCFPFPILSFSLIGVEQVHKRYCLLFEMKRNEKKNIHLTGSIAHRKLHDTQIRIEYFNHDIRYEIRFFQKKKNDFLLLLFEIDFYTYIISFM